MFGPHAEAPSWAQKHRDLTFEPLQYQGRRRNRGGRRKSSFPFRHLDFLMTPFKPKGKYLLTYDLGDSKSKHSILGAWYVPNTT